MNAAHFVGRLTRDPEKRMTQSGKIVVNFHVAVKMNSDHVEFLPVSAWGTLAETLLKYGYKGMMVGVAGKLRVDSYEKQGVKITSVSIEAVSIDFLSRKPAADKAPGLEDLTAEDTDLPF